MDDNKGEVILQLYKIQRIILTYSHRITVIYVTPNKLPEIMPLIEYCKVFIESTNYVLLFH